VGGGSDGAADPGSARVLRAEGIAGVGGGADGAADSESARVQWAEGIAIAAFDQILKRPQPSLTLSS